METAAVGSLFAFPGADDADSRQNGVREYQLRADATPAPPFDLKVWCNAWVGGLHGIVYTVYTRTAYTN